MTKALGYEKPRNEAARFGHFVPLVGLQHEIVA